MSASFEIPDAAKELVPAEKLAKIVSNFADIDRDGDGRVTLDEYLDHMLAEHRARLLHKFQYLDTDGDGTIAFEEFLTATESSYAVLKKFRECDLDGDGLLDYEEALRAAEILDLPYSSDDIKAALERRADLDRDGKVTYDEYFGLIVRYGFQ
ncbi:Ca2+-binding protein (EF-Hand superfamily) [Rubidibacter lacunae KORDI 51-2]|uniref:Ca2+-binding protein (EF-Hand superfamily) n=1 Tax=Rubidibacter lacunae KORDI 51-2 TaxID=582515 RepID=U5DDR9_9CHRO|nr:EF-hand domain-containing protein [Rubidibacter lacunae]ERN39776.1 Ca2+-binding protein (EF-Hand superfamily) [Rubidibacter lacunae KORDI 51-2]